MQKARKQNVANSSNKKNKNNPKNDLLIFNEPYPNHPRPTPEQCLSVRDDLLSLHGFPEEFAKYRKFRFHSGISSNSLETNHNFKLESLEDDVKVEDGEKESVLDGLVRTLLSQNTTEVNSKRAFDSLKAAFPTWEQVLDVDPKCIENTIKCGGLAVTKASCIKNLLATLLEKKGNLCLEYLRDLPVDQIKAELSGFKGIGPKTVACVLMFNLQRDDFPVDTHVFRITKAMGWIPYSADREKAYLHLNKRLPNELKFDLNCLFVTHGKLCQRCSTKRGDQQSRPDIPSNCPLSIYCSFSVLKEFSN